MPNIEFKYFDDKDITFITSSCDRSKKSSLDEIIKSFYLFLEKIGFNDQEIFERTEEIILYPGEGEGYITDEVEDYEEYNPDSHPVPALVIDEDKVNNFVNEINNSKSLANRVYSIFLKHIEEN